MIRRQVVVLLFAVVSGIGLATGCSGEDGVATGAQVEPIAADALDVPGDAAGGGSAASTGPTIAGKWVLDALMVDGAKVELPTTGDLEMEIELGQIRGSGGCNTFGGTVDRGDSGTLSIDDLFMTEMACDLLDFEQIYVGALGDATRWEADPAGITLRSDNAELRYIHGAPPVHLALVDTEWTLDTLYAGEGIARTASTPDMSQAEVVLTINGDFATLRSADCADYTLALRYEDGIDNPMLAPDTETLLEPECAGAGDNFFAALDGLVNASGFMINESRLTLIGLPGELVGFRG